MENGKYNIDLITSKKSLQIGQESFYFVSFVHIK